jgi:uncharacterized protein (DUF2062 family)
VESNPISLKKSNGDSNSWQSSTVSSLQSDGFLYRRIALPILALLRRGASPRRLAWSIALGLLVGINPVLGSTTVLCLGLAMLLRLNVAVSQLVNHIIYPFQLLLLLPFLQLGSDLFHAEPLPFSARTLIEMGRKDPLEFVRKIWRWELHAFLIWIVLAVVLIPIIGVALTPLLRRVSTRIQRRNDSADLPAS